MSLFSAAEIASLRDLQEESFNDTAVIMDPAASGSPDGAGGRTKTAGTVATEPCRVSPMKLTRGESMFGGRFQNAVAYQIALPFDSAVAEPHQIVVGSDTYEVVGIWEAGTHQTVTKAICLKR